MNSLKKSIAIALLAVFAVSGVSCDKKKDNSKGNGDTPSTTDPSISNVVDEDNKYIVEKAFSTYLSYYNENGDVLNVLNTPSKIESIENGVTVKNQSDIDNTISGGYTYATATDEDVSTFIDNIIANEGGHAPYKSNLFVSGTANISYTCRLASNEEIIFAEDYCSWNAEEKHDHLDILSEYMKERPVGETFTFITTIDGSKCNVSCVINWIENESSVGEYNENFIKTYSKGACSTDEEFREYIREIINSENSNFIKNENAEMFEVDIESYRSIINDIADSRLQLLNECAVNTYGYESLNAYLDKIEDTAENKYATYKAETEDLVKNTAVACYIINAKSIEVTSDAINDAAQEFLANKKKTPYEYLLLHTPEELRCEALCVIANNALAE